MLIATAAVPPFALAAPAAACVVSISPCDGTDAQCHPTEAQRRAQERQWSAEATRVRALEAQARARRNEADFAAELAELLVPNVRPVWREMTSCGPTGDIDRADGEETQESWFARIVEGTPLAGADYQEFYVMLRRAEVDLSFGRSCNDEFRRSFADFLTGALAPEELQQAWLFLKSRQRDSTGIFESYHRLMTFDGRTRAPPVRWSPADPWLAEQIERFLHRDPAGRALAAAVDRFWAERGATLTEDAQVCPVFAAQWRAERESLIPRMIAWRAGVRPD